MQPAARTLPARLVLAAGLALAVLYGFLRFPFATLCFVLHSLGRSTLKALGTSPIGMS